jgi:excinuclease ABC subunit A
VNRGHSLAVIVDNLTVILEADCIRDLGPDGGKDGGQLVTRGSPREMLRQLKRSHTVRALKQYLAEETFQSHPPRRVL